MSKIKFIFYTNNPENAVKVETGVTFNGNIASVPITKVLFDGLEEGVLNYIVEGELNGESFIFQRQSNYYLKTPTNYTPSEPSSCNLGTLDITFEDLSGNGECWWYANDYGYDGLTYIKVNAQDYYSTAYNEGYNAGQEAGGGGSCNLTTLEVTENGTYCPTGEPILIFDGDDAFNFAYADTSNTIEVKFKVNDRGWIFGNTTAGLFAEDKNLVSVYWFGYEGLFYIRENEVNTILIKPYDADGPVIVNGQDYAIGEREFDSTESTEILIGGNEGERGYFDFYYAKFWSEYNSYHNGEVALFYNIPNEDGNIKYSTGGGDFQISTNVGGGACQFSYACEFNGFSEVIVNVETQTSCNLQDRFITPEADNVIDDNFLIVTAEEGYDGMSRVVMTRTEASAPSKYIAIYNRVMKDFESINQHISEVLSTEVDNAQSNQASMEGIFSSSPYLNQGNEGFALFCDSTCGGNALTSINNLSTDSNTGVAYIQAINCENVETCENAFANMPLLGGLDKLQNLGNAFITEQTLDLSGCPLLAYNPISLKCLAKSLFNFAGSHNQFDITTAYIKLPSGCDYTPFTDRGWTIAE